VTEPGVHDSMPAEVYHGDPVPGGSLSSGGARKLLPPSCPALFDHGRRHPQPHKRTFDFGHAAHLKVLGEGPELVEIDADTYRTKKAQDARDEAYAADKIPLLSYEFAQVEEMAAALRRHPVASRLFAPGSGRPEQSLFWVDERTGVTCRARPDWLPYPIPGRRLIVPDYKSCHAADIDALSKAVYNFGYHQQAPWYIDGIQALDIAQDVAFVFVAQEKTAPYLITVFELDEVAMQIGRDLNRDALDVYQQCSATGEWPAYNTSIAHLSLPPWAENQHMKETAL
jgi:hypothetical protein